MASIPNDPYEPHLFDKLPGEWWDNAACKHADPELFFPESHTPRHRIKEAKAICEGCPSRAECLEFALTPPAEMHGLWGGHTQKELQKIRVKRKRSSDLTNSNRGTN